MRPRTKQHQCLNAAEIANPRQFLADVALLIAQSREEFDKSAENRKRAAFGLPSSSRIERATENVVKELNAQEVANLHARAIPTCLYVLLLPARCSQQNICIEDAPVLERWTLCVSPRLAMKTNTGDQYIDGYSLQKAVKSYLHFSHLNSLLSKNVDKSPLTTICKVRVPGESAPADEPFLSDALLCDRNSFRPCLLDKSSLLHVSVESAPRTFSLDAIRCRCADADDDDEPQPSPSGLSSHGDFVATGHFAPPKELVSDWSTGATAAPHSLRHWTPNVTDGVIDFSPPAAPSFDDARRFFASAATSSNAAAAATAFVDGDANVSTSSGCSAFNPLFDFNRSPLNAVVVGGRSATQRLDYAPPASHRFDQPDVSKQSSSDVHFFFPDDDDDFVAASGDEAVGGGRWLDATAPPKLTSPRRRARRRSTTADDDAATTASSSDWSPSSPPQSNVAASSSGVAGASAAACRRILFGGDDDAPSLLDFVDAAGLARKGKDSSCQSICSTSNVESEVYAVESKPTLDINRRSFVPSLLGKKLHKYANKSTAILRFNRRTGLPLSSSPAPITRNRSSFDFDANLTATSAIKKALQGYENENASSDSDGGVPLCKSAPACTNLLGNFEESALNGRLQPFGSVDGFTLELGASGSFWPPHVTLPVTTLFFDISDDNAPSPYFGHCSLESVGRKGYCTPKKGTVQATLFNPQGTVVKMFVVRYDLTDMPPYCQTFVRQRTFFMPSSASLSDAMHNRSWLRYLIHLRFATGKSGKLYLHTDIRMLFSRKSEMDAYNCEFGKKQDFSVLETYELRSFTEMPKNPKFSPRKCASSSNGHSHSTEKMRKS